MAKWLPSNGRVGPRAIESGNLAGIIIACPLYLICEKKNHGHCFKVKVAWGHERWCGYSITASYGLLLLSVWNSGSIKLHRGAATFPGARSGPASRARLLSAKLLRSKKCSVPCWMTNQDRAATNMSIVANRTKRSWSGLPLRNVKNKLSSLLKSAFGLNNNSDKLIKVW